MSYHATLRRAEKFYKTLMSTQSSHFGGAWVVFNNIGFKHLIRKAKVRTRKEQRKRFALLYEVPEVLQDPRAAVVSYRIDESKNLPVQYWAIQREKNGVKIKVIVRQVGNGKKHFYSVMDVP
jgi:hypothetical protein